MAQYPTTRLRRNRSTNWIRELVAQNHLQISSLIQPFFVIEGNNCQQPINSMPGIARYSIDLLIQQAKKAQDLGIKAIMLFPSLTLAQKTTDAKESYNQDNLICRAIYELKKNLDLGIIVDVALDPYTINAHDGLMIGNEVDNDLTIEILCKQALALAKAGCDVIAPSDMMDGRIGKIRQYLDQYQFQNIAIISYGAKYASNFYGPFRDAVGSSLTGVKINKSTYQMDFRNSDEAMTEIALDIAEGADMIIVKPAMCYLDIIQKAAKKFTAPIIAYQVSGEYAMMKAASANNWLHYDLTMMESLISIKRAGARSIITYGAMEIAKKL